MSLTWHGPVVGRPCCQRTGPPAGRRVALASLRHGCAALPPPPSAAGSRGCSRRQHPSLCSGIGGGAGRRAVAGVAVEASSSSSGSSVYTDDEHGENGAAHEGKTQDPFTRLFSETLLSLGADAADDGDSSGGDGEEAWEDEDGEEEDDDEPPPLPVAQLLELSGLVASVDLVASGSGSQAPWPESFCPNCTRRRTAPDEPCAACGHRPEDDHRLLHHQQHQPWAAAYSAQLAAQQQQQRDGEGSSSSSVSVSSSGAGGGGVLLACDGRMMLHRASIPPCPERPERVSAVMGRLHEAGLMARCRLLACRPATDSELLAVHSQRVVDLLGLLASSPTPPGADTTASTSAAAAAADGGEEAAAYAALHPDTLFNRHTAAAVRLAAGAAADIGVALARGSARRAFGVIRPPGAQAGPDAMRSGCYVNNVGVAALAARAAGAARVLVVDWDVHHGRGTRQALAGQPGVLYVSLHRHQEDFYPGTGAVDEDAEEGPSTSPPAAASAAAQGSGTAAAAAAAAAPVPSAPVNVAYAGGGLTDSDLLSAALHVVLPVAYQFQPSVVLVSAGFGMLRHDPTGGCAASPAVFGHLTHLLAGVAPTGLLLEGGYELQGLAQAAEACTRALLGEQPPPLERPWQTSSTGWVGVMNAMQIQSAHWSSLQPLSFQGWMATIRRQQQAQQEEQRGEVPVTWSDGDEDDDDDDDEDGGLQESAALRAAAAAAGAAAAAAGSSSLVRGA